MMEPRRLRVLIVEDSEDDAELLIRELQRGSYEVNWVRVETAGAMRSALESQDWDLVVADFHLPRFSAPAAIELLQGTELDVPLIIVSGSVGEEIAVQSMRAGARDFLLKGSLKRLMPAVERELEQSRQRRARRQAEESNRLLAAIVGSSDDAIISTDLSGNILSWNRGAERMYGYSAEEMNGRPVSILESPEKGGEVAELLEGLRVGKGLSRYETTRVRKDGTPIDVAVSLFPIPGAFGGIVGAASIARDITERRKAEEALRRSEERYRSLIESSRDVITVVDPQGTIRFASPSMERVGGYRPEEVTGENAFVYVHPEDVARLKARLAEILTRETPTVPIAFRFRHKDGSWRIFEAVGNNRVWDPQVGGIVLNSRDVTEIQHAEEALRQSEERYRLLFETNPQPLWVFDEKTLAFLAVNDAACHHYGYSRQEFLGMTIRDIRPPEDVAPLLRRLEEESEDYQESGIWRHRKKDGSVIEVEITSHPLLFDGRDAQIVLALDVTERRQLEAQLHQSQKMEAVGTLAGGIAHDFNNLLTTILGYGGLLLERLEETSPLREEVVEIQKAGERAASLTRQLLAFSRKQVLAPVDLDLNGVVTDMEKMLRRLIGEDVSLAAVLDSHLWTTRADPGQIEQVIVNLVVNARDAMPRGGKVTIETLNCDLDDSYIRTHAYAQKGEHVCLSISDTGRGMDAETRSRIFEPFFTTKGPGKGTGLGLSTVYGIIKQSGGSIEVYSEPERGTVFKIYLPRSSSSRKLQSKSARQPPTGGTETILLVEDEEAVRRLARLVLEKKGYTVLEGASAEEALSVSARHTERVDLLLTDSVMPGMSGPDLARLMCSQRPGMRVLFMSGYTDDAIVRHGLLAPTEAFLQKPFSPDALGRKVREVLDSKEE